MGGGRVPKVSIIIPVYNVEKYLYQCLESVINQTLKDIEIICVNDCSSDDSLNILKEYSEKDKRIVIIDLEENRGQGYCRNIAIDRASGDYIMFLDSDDWLDLDACELAYNQISKNQNDFVMFNYQRYLVSKDMYHAGTDFKKTFGDKINESRLKVSEFDVNYIENCFSTCRIYSKDFLNKNNIRYADLRFNQDNVFVFNAAVSADTISILDKPLYFYRIHNESTCFNPKHWQYIIPARMESYKVLKEKNADEKLMSFFIIYAVKTVLRWYRHFVKMDKSIKKELFMEVKDFFILLSKEAKPELLKNEINNESLGAYEHFRQIVKYDYPVYLFARFLQKMFSIHVNSQFLYIRLLGAKIRLKKKRK